jgi:hypothetical protein
LNPWGRHLTCHPFPRDQSRLEACSTFIPRRCQGCRPAMQLPGIMRRVGDSLAEDHRQLQLSLRQDGDRRTHFERETSQGHLNHRTFAFATRSALLTPAITRLRRATLQSLKDVAKFEKRTTAARRSLLCYGTFDSRPDCGLRRLASRAHRHADQHTRNTVSDAKISSTAAKSVSAPRIERIEHVSTTNTPLRNDQIEPLIQ